MTEHCHILIISGSQRRDSHSVRMARVIERRLAGAGPMEGHTLDLGEAQVPWWGEAAPDGSDWTPIVERLRSADGFVLVAPEWSGMVPPVLMNLLMSAQRELAHKPAFLVGVSAGAGGTYPITQLRAFGGKNNHLCFLPDHLILRDVERLHLDDTQAVPEGMQLNRMALDRLDHGLRMLHAYAVALRQVRAVRADDIDRFPYGG